MTDRLQVVFLDRETISPQTIMRPPAFRPRHGRAWRTAPQDVAARIAQADIVIVNKVRLDRAAILAAPRLKNDCFGRDGHRQH